MNILQSAKTKLGNTIELISEDKKDNNVLIIGVFHGDEPQGKYLIEKYLEKCPPLPNPPPRGGREKPPYKNTNFIKENAKKLRKNSTDAEKILWSVLRANNILGLHFKRQQPIYKYVVDFVCFSRNLIIELDGSQHIEQKTYDTERTKFLESQGFKVIRIWNNDVFNNLDSVIEYIIDSLPPCGGGLGRGGNLLFIPCLNPDGLAAGKRTNLNGVDLNRNFPTQNWGQDTSAAGENPADYNGGCAPASEIETKFVIDIIDKYKPKLILTLHAPYKIVNFDGPAEYIAHQISKIIKYPIEPSIGYPTPGSFGTYCGIERNIPTITLELDEKIPVEQLEQPVFEIFDLLRTMCADHTI